MRANAARLAFGGCQSPASIAFIYGNVELPLLKPSKGANLPPNLLESGECRLISMSVRSYPNLVPPQPSLTDQYASNLMACLLASEC
jgi:hypothetical protein